MIYEQLFLYALLATLLTEVLVVLLILRYRYKNYNNISIIFSGVISSALTLPYFWFILPVFISDRMIYIIVGEVMIILIEAFIYFYLLRLKFSQALIVSLIANIVSILVGLIVM
jgi:hypothetical protein